MKCRRVCRMGLIRHQFEGLESQLALRFGRFNRVLILWIKGFAVLMYMQALLMLWSCRHGHNIRNAWIYSRYTNLLSRCTINILLKFIILYFNNFILPRPKNLYVILPTHNDLPEDDILSVETCRSMLLVIIVFDIIVQSLVKL